MALLASICRAVLGEGLAAGMTIVGLIGKDRVMSGQIELPAAQPDACASVRE